MIIYILKYMTSDNVVQLLLIWALNVITNWLIHKLKNSLILSKRKIDVRLILADQNVFY